MFKKSALIFLILAIYPCFALGMGGKPKLPEKLQAIIKTNKGDIVCDLYTKQAPKTVDNFIKLALGEKEWTDPRTGKRVEKPLYSGTIFHRVIPDFMIQGGDPLGLGIGGPGYTFEDEISQDLNFEKSGILAMANSGPNTNGSQFFITVAPTPWLQGRHTIFGQVIQGQDIADAISQVKRNEQDKPVDAVIIEDITIKEAI